MLEKYKLLDSFGRRFPYLRLSVTDVCNFRCTYCLPDGYKKTGCDTFLSADEILRAVKAFANLGVQKIRLTGGEPTVRPDFLEIASRINDLEQIQMLALTTNGYKLPERAAKFYDAGIRNINISIDSLDSDVFKSITGHDRLKEVLEGIEICQEIGFEKIKINTVLLKGVNDICLPQFLNLVQDKNISLRFIELMQTLTNLDYYNKYHLSGEVIKKQLLDMQWSAVERSFDAGPAQEFSHPKSRGNIGLIMPYSKDFCKTCNRLRFSAKGGLHLCLFGEGGHSLRHLLQDDNQQAELENAILELMHFKKSSHFLHDGNSGQTPHLASIGG